MRADAQELTIFEGADGTGKTTAARAFAALTGAEYVHLGPFPELGEGRLGAAYLAAMAPAVLSRHRVVMDRCWISEPIYGRAFRGGADRLDPDERGALERVAWGCSRAVVVHCRAPLGDAVAAFRARRGEEMLETEAQLREVWATYDLGLDTRLPVVDFRWKDHGASGAGWLTRATWRARADGEVW